MPDNSLYRAMAQGQAGVYRVVSELILRGHAPYLPVYDTGVDLIIDNGIRIQVKSTRGPTASKAYATGTYLFMLQKGDSIKAGRKVEARPAKKFSAFCDFLILWAADSDRFWIVPAEVLDNRHSCVIGPTAQWKEFDVEYAKSELEKGRSGLSLARELGVTAHTIKRRLTTFQTKARRQTSAIIKTFENRWDILSPSPTEIEPPPLP